MGLVNRVVPRGQARVAAIELAEQLSRFPQVCMNSDRLSAYEQFGLDLDEAIRNEFRRGMRALREEAVAGASRFASGKGRGGAFDDI
jgi:enoyl-CoA hydratase